MSASQEETLVDVGDRVTYFDEDGDPYDAVVFDVYPPGTDGRSMVDVVFNPANDDGDFERASGERYDEQLDVDTSVQEAEEISEPQTFTAGGWSP